MPEPILPHGGRWFIAAGVAFHADAGGVIDFADTDDVPGEWVTIGGGAGPNGERHVGGFPAKVTGGTVGDDGKKTGGTIVGGKLAGRLGLHGKSTDEVADHLAAVNEHRDAGKSLTEAVRAAGEGAKKVADVPTPPGRDLGNGLYLFDGLADEQYLVNPKRLADALGMADKLDEAAAAQSKKRGKKNKAEADFATKTAADIRAQVADIRAGTVPQSHRDAALYHAEREERRAAGERSGQESRARSIRQNTPRYEHLKKFVDEEGYFPMPGTATKGGRKYLGTAAQRMRLTEGGHIEVYTAPDVSTHSKPMKWLRLTDQAVDAALVTAGWRGPSRWQEYEREAAEPPKDRLATIKDAAVRLVKSGTTAHHEIHDALKADDPGLTYGEFRDAMAQLRSECRVRGRKWDRLLDDHPHPETLHFAPEGGVIGYADPV